MALNANPLPQATVSQTGTSSALNAPLLIQLPADGPGKQERMALCLSPLHLYELPALDPIWGVNQGMKRLSSSKSV